MDARRRPFRTVLDLQVGVLRGARIMAEPVAHDAREHLGDERRLARPGHAGHRGQDTEGELGVDVVEVVPGDVVQAQP